MADPVSFFAHALPQTAQALADAFRTLSETAPKDRTNNRVSRLTDEVPIDAVSVPIDIPKTLAKQPHLIAMTELMAHLALNPAYDGSPKQLGIEFLHGATATSHPLLQPQPEDYLDHGVRIAKNTDGEWRATFYSRDMKSLLGADGTEAYPLAAQLNEMLIRWKYALRKELADPARWLEERESERVARIATGKKLAQTMPKSGPTISDGKNLLEEDMNPQSATHALSLEARANYQAKGFSGLTIAVLDNHEENAVGLLKEGADPNEIIATEREPLTAYSLACWNKNMRMIRLLAHHGGKPTYENAMADAVMSGDIKIIDLMRKMGASVNQLAVDEGF